MPLVKQRGNMYSWVTHQHSHLRGACPHACEYCYVKSYRNPKPYQGDVRLEEKELSVSYGNGKTIFIEHSSDLFAEGVPGDYIDKIIQHCLHYERGNTFLFQTKNPKRMLGWYEFMPEKCIFGTTIETNYDLRNFRSAKTGKPLSLAPPPEERYKAMLQFGGIRCATGEQLMVTIEPIMEFDLDVLSQWIIDIKPDFINIGADSKHHNLPEPTWDEVMALVDVLDKNRIKINYKSNLERLRKDASVGERQ